MSLFVVVEGPNGVGKTAVAAALAGRLAARTGTRVHLTGEPTRTPFGDFLRIAESTLYGRALALAVAADRYMHIDEEIIPRLDDGWHVVSDRYVQSSLVLQRVDAVELPEIWTYNRYVLPPNLSVYLEDDPASIAARLATRLHLSRLEVTGGPDRELRLYREARRYLGRQSWRQEIVDCRHRTPVQIADLIVDLLPTDHDG